MESNNFNSLPPSSLAQPRCHTSCIVVIPFSRMKCPFLLRMIGLLPPPLLRFLMARMCSNTPHGTKAFFFSHFHILLFMDALLPIGLHSTSMRILWREDLLQGLSYYLVIPFPSVILSQK